MSPDQSRMNHVIGSGLSELFRRARLLGTGHDHDRWGHLSRGEGDENVRGITRHYRDEHLGPIDPGGAENLLLVGVSGNIEVTESLDLRNFLRCNFDSNEG